MSPLVVGDAAEFESSASGWESVKRLQKLIIQKKLEKSLNKTFTKTPILRHTDSVKFLEHMLGPSLSRPPLPPYWALYAQRFRWVARQASKFVFSKVGLFRQPDPETLAMSKVVLYANHPGFWDPVLLALLTERFWPAHPVLSPIDETALRRHWYFHGLGFFGVRPFSARGMRVLLRTTGTALGRPEPHLIALTPEGRFTPSQERPLRLCRGLARILWGYEGEKIAVLPVALAYRKRMAALTVGQPLFWEGAGGFPSLASLNANLTGRLEMALDRLEDDLDSGARALDLSRPS